jgi:hypothetical protein
LERHRFAVNFPKLPRSDSKMTALIVVMVFDTDVEAVLQITCVCIQNVMVIVIIAAGATATGAGGKVAIIVDMFQGGGLFFVLSPLYHWCSLA